MKSKQKGDLLEAQFHQYLLDEKAQGRLVFEAYTPQNCEIFRKKKYACNEREIEFDLVIEIRRTGRAEPHAYVVFECKNYTGAVREPEIINFSTNVSRAFGHKGTAVLVITSRLQPSAFSFADSAGVAVFKFDESGLETVIERTGATWLENRFVQRQLVGEHTATKSLKFSGYQNKQYFSSVGGFIQKLVGEPSASRETTSDKDDQSLPFIPRSEINRKSQELLDRAGYIMGPVDLEKICEIVSVQVEHSDAPYIANDDVEVLGAANFNSRTIKIYQHSNQKRERFTLAHEIGHFWLQHDVYLRNEIVLAADIKLEGSEESAANYERLEIQANIFASCILMPDHVFKNKLDDYRKELDIRDRFHGALFVDGQMQNLADYHVVLSRLSDYFGCSKQAVEIKLKTLNLLIDHRKVSRRLEDWQPLGRTGPI